MIGASTSRSALLAALLVLGMPGASHAQTESPADAAVSIWRLSLYKTITFETVANAADIALFALFFGGTPAAAAGFFVINTTTAATTYYTHEIVWDYFAPVDEETEVGTALAKTITHRVVSTARHLALGGFYGAGIAASVAFAAAGQVTEAVLYFTNERLWVIYGPPIAR